jgi:hypothetical protein
MGKASRNKVKQKAGKRQVGTNLTQILAEDLNQFKIRTSHNLMSNDVLIKELKRDVATYSKALGSILDLITDYSGLPQNVLTERFLFYCQEREILDNEGNTKGNAKINLFNF